MAITPPAVVAGASRSPLPFGLFSVVPFREGSPDRWLNGVIFEGLGCVDDFEGIGEIICPSEETPEPTTKGLPLELDAEGLETSDTFKRFTITESYKCSPIGNTLERAEEVARQRLEAWEELRVEEAISTDILGITPNLGSGSTGIGNFGDIVEAIGELEDTIGSEYGSQGVLHMKRSTALKAFAKGALTSSGQRLRTALGTPVIAGAGYSFDGVVGTPAMFGYRSEIYTSSNEAGDLLDRKRNNLHSIANRDYLIAWDICDTWSAGVGENND